MKKTIFTLFILVGTLMSCSSDDNSSSSNSIDPIIGTWRLTSQIVDGNTLDDLTLGCDLEADLIFNSDGDFSWEELIDNTGNCELDELLTGTWSRVSDGVYLITSSGETSQSTLSFSNNNNMFSVTEVYTDPAQTETSVYTRQ